MLKNGESGRQTCTQAEQSDQQACTKLHYKITHADLPLSCPPRDERVWDAHPRVYLPIEETGKVICPYCGAEYVLTDFVLTDNPRE